MHLLTPHPVVLLLDRLLDLEDELGFAPDVVSAVDDPCPRGDVLLVGVGPPPPRRSLDQNLMVEPGELVLTGGRDGHPVLVVLDFLRNSDLHFAPFSSV